MKSITETILLVDDEPEDLSIMSVALKAQGFQVFETGNYDAALSTFDRHKGAIDLLVSDISLPGNNGCELARVILALKPDLKVLFVSGHAGAEICRFYGFSIADVHFLRKPFNAASLVARVRRIMTSSESFEFGMTPQQSARGAAQ